MIRAMRYRYFARSRPGSFDQADRCASRAAVTARLTSAFEACATLASGSSVAGLMTVNVLRGFDGANSLPMKSPYSGSMWMWSVASGAGAYSHGTSPPAARPHEFGAGRDSGFLVSVIASIIAPDRFLLDSLTHGDQVQAARPSRSSDADRLPARPLQHSGDL